MVQELCVENIVSSLEIKMCSIDVSMFHTNRLIQKYQYNSIAKTSPDTSLYIFLALPGSIVSPSGIDFCV